jgi:hypothetical protein
LNLLAFESGELDVDDRSLFVPKVLTAELVDAIFDCGPPRVWYLLEIIGGDQTDAALNAETLLIAQQTICDGLTWILFWWLVGEIGLLWA